VALIGKPHTVTGSGAEVASNRGLPKSVEATENVIFTSPTESSSPVEAGGGWFVLIEAGRARDYRIIDNYEFLSSAYSERKALAGSMRSARQADGRMAVAITTLILATEYFQNQHVQRLWMCVVPAALASHTKNS